MTKEEIGQILKDLRTRAGLTQKEVAERIGRKQQIIGHWETGYSQPDADTLFVLCDIYNASVDDAFGFGKGGSTDNRSTVSISEWEIIKKYRSLDLRGQKAVLDTLNRECEFAEASNARLDLGALVTDAIATVDDVSEVTNIINQPKPTNKK